MHCKYKLRTGLQNLQTMVSTRQRMLPPACMPSFVMFLNSFLYHYLNLVNQQEMEKYNDLASKDYFRSTSHRSVKCLHQMFLKKNRLQFLQGVGCERVKLSYKCSNCNNHGHTIKTCCAKCSSCEPNVCCSHLQG